MDDHHYNHGKLKPGPIVKVRYERAGKLPPRSIWSEQTPNFEALRSGAVFSPCRSYRYELWRTWIGGSGYAMFVGLNPSTADETQDDPTIRRCVGFAKAWGYAGLCMTNLFAFRATDPQDMIDSAQAGIDIVGAGNDQSLREAAGSAGVVVAAWGVHGALYGRDEAVRAMLPKLHYLRLTKRGAPGHPLYLPKALEPTLWSSHGIRVGP